MVDIDKAVTARLKIGSTHFEILVDCEKAFEFKKGKCELEDALATDEIFKNVKQGERASEHEMQELFNITDTKVIAEKIIKEGEVQLTAEHKNKKREEIKKKIINIIHINAINPQTNLPHPPQRIENAINEIRINISETKKAEEQVKDVVEKLRTILPIKFEIREIAVKVPAKFAGASYNILKSYGKLLQDEWQNDGSLVAAIELPAGLQEQFESELNKVTHGEIEVKLLNRR